MKGSISGDPPPHTGKSVGGSLPLARGKESGDPNTLAALAGSQGETLPQGTSTTRKTCPVVFTSKVRVIELSVAKNGSLASVHVRRSAVLWTL